MQNDRLKNKIAPWQEKGRWYHATIQKSGATFVLVNQTSDVFIINNYRITGNQIVLCNSPYVILSAIIKYPSNNIGSSSTTITATPVLLTSNESAITLTPYVPNNSTFDIWAFIV